MNKSHIFHTLHSESWLVFLFIVILGVILLKYSTLLEEEYNETLIKLYIYPWWRMLLVILLITSIMWSPYIGIFIGMILFFYLSDMNILINPVANL